MSTSADIDTQAILTQLIEGNDLEPAVVEGLFGAIMDGALEPAVVAAVLVALRIKGETGAEVAAAARAMRSRALKVPVASPATTIDTCGTGGDGAGTINISTAAALVAAAAGVKVAKHGNRSVSSSCGAADVLEAAGVALTVGPAEMAALVDELGIAFLFAPALHPAMRAVVPIRKALKVRTIFNLLGPLTNPAGVRRQVLGVWGADVQPLVASALADLEVEHALVVHSHDGLDELSVSAPSTVIEIRNGQQPTTWEVRPAELGITAGDPSSVKGGETKDCAARLKAILDGREHSAAAEAVALNSGAALYVAGKATDLADGLEQAREVLASGSAGRLLEKLARRSQELAADA